MDMSVTYTNHKLQSVTFGSDSLHYFENDLRDSTWSFDEYNGRARNYRLQGKTVEFKVGIAAANEEEGLDLRDKLYRVLSVDAEAGKQGAISILGYSVGCVCVGMGNAVYNYGDRFLECNLSLRIDDPVWRKGTTLFFSIKKDRKGDNYLDYPYDYNYDYSSPARNSTINNPSSQAGGSDFIIRAYGPCTNPYIQIAGNSYRVNITVPSGAYLEINSAQGTVELVSLYGDRTNAYNERQRGAKDSGTYVFQKIPTGISTISWSNAFNFDLTMFDERSIPPWR